MATQVLHCAGCNVNFRAKAYDPSKTYKCPKCAGKLQPQTAAKGGDGVTLESKAPGRRAAAKDPLVGRKIGQYKILKKLGEGGMGAVYQAAHLDLDRKVALKILPPGLARDDPDAIERFKREARSAAVLQHPNIVIIYAVGSDGEHHFIEQEFVDGESLQQRLEREGKLPLDDATRIVQDAAGAFAAAHKQNIIHRDIKPANIMLTSEGQVKVMDFGLAKDVTGATQLTLSGHIMGTPHYMSPEQCEAGKLDGRADIYSLGATYYHLFTGAFPYQGDSLLSILRQHTDAPIPQVQAKRPDAPAGVQAIIDRAMAKKPEDRFQTMEEFAAALGNVAQPPSAVSGAPPFAVRRTGKGTGTQRGAAVLPGDQSHGAQPPSAVDRGRDAEAAEGRSHRVPGSAATMAHAGLDGLRQSVWYFYWDKYLHNRVAAGIAVAAGVLLACVIGWQVAVHWPKGEKPSASFTSVSSVTSVVKSESALRTPQSAIPSVPSVSSVVKSDLPKPFIKPSRAAAPQEPEADILAEKPAYPGFFVLGTWGIGISRKGFKVNEQAELDRLKKELALMKSFGLNAAAAAGGLYAPDGKPHIAKIAQELGMHIASFNSGLTQIYKSKKPVSTSEVAKLITQDAQRLKDYPNLFEYFVWLDPPEPHFKLGDWRVMCEAAVMADPTRAPHFIYVGADKTRPYWQAHPLPSIHYQVYPLSAKRTSAESMRGAVSTLKSFCDLAPDASHFPWLQAFGGGPDHRRPQPPELRCLVHLALAHAAKGLFFFAWQSRRFDTLLDKNGQPTENANEVKRLSQVLEKIGPVLMRLKLGPDMANASAGAVAKTLVSKAGRQYAFVVNCDVTKPVPVQVLVKKATMGVPSGVRDVLDGRDVPAQVSAGSLSFVARLEPGEGRLFQVLNRESTSARPKLPPGFEKAFMLPDSDKDRHGNPVVERGRDAASGDAMRKPAKRDRIVSPEAHDPVTGWPYEIWLKEPRMEFVLIPAGEFLMGSSEEEIKGLEGRHREDVARWPDLFSCEGPQHRVRITRAFYLAKYETTVAQFRWFVDKTGYRTDAEKGEGAYLFVEGKRQKMPDASWRNPYFEQGDQNPVACVSWNDAMAFCKTLADSVAVEVALPTEAQWEYACRAGSTGPFCYGDDPEAKQLGEYARYASNSGFKTHPVGQKRPNAWGLYDVHGNLREWCQDGERGYTPSTETDPRGSGAGCRVLRGGSWVNSPRFVRSACRAEDAPTEAYSICGFRVSLCVRPFSL